MLSEYWTRNGPVELNYAERPGPGPKILLLHGLTARWQVFRPLSRGLPGHLYALDFRGHGASGRAPGRYRLADYVGDALALLDLIDGPAAVLGHSMGGWVALAIAAARPDRVAGVAVADSVLFPERLGPDRDDLAELPATLRAMTTSLTRLDPEVLWRFRTRAAADFDPRAVLTEVGCPVLLLQGDAAAGGLMSDEDAARGAALLPDCRRVRFAGLGHGLHVEDAGRVAAVVLPFIEEVTTDHYGRRVTS